jgi:hypothetical protein
MSHAETPMSTVKNGRERRFGNYQACVGIPGRGWHPSMKIRWFSSLTGARMADNFYRSDEDKHFKPSIKAGLT